MTRYCQAKTTVEIAFVLALVVIAVVLFATEKLPADLVALLVMGALLVSGIISPEEGIAGFSSITAALLVLDALIAGTGTLWNLLFWLLAIHVSGRFKKRMCEVRLSTAIF